MIAAVESDAPPLRLMLGADAYGLWEQKRAVMDEEAAQWRAVGEDTAFADAKTQGYRRLTGTKARAGITFAGWISGLPRNPPLPRND